MIHVTREDEANYAVQEGELLGSDMEEALVGDGEIDWDCPCLQGMAQGACGENFKTAFTCFVTSTSDPKGSECVEHFVAMRDCMVAHPQEYPDLAPADAAEAAAVADAPEAPAVADAAGAASSDNTPPAAAEKSP